MYNSLRLILLIAIIICISLNALAQPVQKEILIGLVPEMNVFQQMKRFQPLGEYLSKKVGIKVNFTILSAYGNILDNIEKSGMDGAFLGSFSASMAHERFDLEPLVRPVNLNGESTYYGHIFVRKDSGIHNIKDMKGKIFAFVDKATTAGYLFPVAHLRENGVSNMNTFFREYYFAGSHDAAVHAVLNKTADIGAAKNTIYDWVRKIEPRVDEELVIIAHSMRVPSNGLCVKRTVDEFIKKRMKEVLLSMNKDSEGKTVLKKFGAQKFIVTTKSDYEGVAALAKKAGIDLKNYDYTNE